MKSSMNPAHAAMRTPPTTFMLSATSTEVRHG